MVRLPDYTGWGGFSGRCHKTNDLGSGVASTALTEAPFARTSITLLKDAT